MMIATLIVTHISLEGLIMWHTICFVGGEKFIVPEDQEAHAV